jgi:transcriptional regulator with XRE-family HTH domain
LWQNGHGTLFQGFVLKMENDSVIETKFVIARNVRYRRMGLNMTQRELGDRVFLGKNAISRKEIGHSSFEAEHLPRIAQVLNVQVSDLFEAEKFYRD